MDHITRAVFLGQPTRIQPKADYRLSVAARDRSAIIRPRLISLTISESRADEADTLDLVLDDSDNGLAIPERGAEIRLSIGWQGSPLVDKGAFTVDEIEHSGAPDTVTIRARAASVTKDLHKRREQSWHGESLADIVRTIANRHALQPAISERFQHVTIAHIDQTQESDMSFLTRLARRYDAVMNIKDHHLVFMPIGTGKTASGCSLPVLVLTRASGDTHRYHVSHGESYEGVRAHFQSNGQAMRKSVLAGGSGNTHIKTLPHTYPSEDEAQSAADAAFARTKRGRATLDFTLALGRPDIYPEMPVIVSGFKPEVDTTPWLVKRAVHALSNNGLSTRVELEVRAM